MCVCLPDWICLYECTHSWMYSDMYMQQTPAICNYCTYQCLSLSLSIYIYIYIYIYTHILLLIVILIYSSFFQCVYTQIYIYWEIVDWKNPTSGKMNKPKHRQHLIFHQLNPLSMFQFIQFSTYSFTKWILDYLVFQFFSILLDAFPSFTSTQKKAQINWYNNFLWISCLSVLF